MSKVHSSHCRVGQHRDRPAVQAPPIRSRSSHGTWWGSTRVQGSGRRPATGRRGLPRGGRLAARPATNSPDSFSRRRPRMSTPQCPRYEEAGFGPSTSRRPPWPICGPPRQPAEHIDAAERQHGHLRRPGHHPDGARRVAGAPTWSTRRSSPPCRPHRPDPAPARTSTNSPATTSRAVEVLGGAARQGDHHPQSGRTADHHARHDLLLLAGGHRPRRGGSSIRQMVIEVGAYVPGYRLRTDPQFDVMPDGSETRCRLYRGRRGGRLPSPLRRQPRHHDGRRGQGRRRNRPTLAVQGGRGVTCRTPEPRRPRHRHLPTGRVARQAPPVHRGRT